MPMFGMGASMTDEERRRLAAMHQSSAMPEQPISYTPGAQRAMDNAPRLQEGQKRQSFWQGGDKFTARDAFAAGLAAVGDGFSNWANGGGGGATNMLVGGRINAMEQAKQARAQAEATARAEQQRQREREEGITDYGRKKVIDKQYEKPPAPRFEQDNAGNVWALDPMTGRPLGEQPVFVDTAPRYIQQDGAILSVPNPYASQGGGQSRAPDRLPPDFFNNPPGGQMPQSAAQPGPVPRLQGSQKINRQQYETQLRQFGGDQTSMNAWMRANNIIVGN